MHDIRDNEVKKSLIAQWEHKYLNYFDNVQKTLDRQFHKDSVLVKKLQTEDDEDLLADIDDQNQYFVSQPVFNTPLDEINEETQS